MPGLQAAGAEVDPVSAAATPALDGLRDAGKGARGEGGRAQGSGVPVLYRELDATLGHPGLPQSATGQATLLTGENAADLMDGHYGPWPGPTLQRLLDAGNLFFDGVAAGGARLANAYPPAYFAARSGRRFRPNAMAYAAVAAGVPQLRDVEYAAGEAVPSDFVGAHLERRGGPLGPVGSARVLSEIAVRYAFTLMDVWLTDTLGHLRRADEGRTFVERVDEVVRFLLEDDAGAVASGTTLVITSDHGNLEDVSVPTHTRNPVPLYVAGPGASEFASASTLQDVAPAVRRVLAGEHQAQA